MSISEEHFRINCQNQIEVAHLNVDFFGDERLWAINAGVGSSAGFSLIVQLSLNRTALLLCPTSRPGYFIFCASVASETKDDG